MSWFPGDYGDVWIDDATGEIALPEVYGSLETPVIIASDDARYQDYGSPGSGVSYLVSPGKPIAQYVDTAPETLPAGFDPAKLVADAAGRYFQYKAATVNGQQVYQRTAYAGGGAFALSPMMLAACAGLAFLTLSDNGK